MRKRNIQVSFYYGEKEKEELDDFTGRTGMTFADYMRTVCCIIPVLPCPEIDYESHAERIRKSGYAINSIIAAYNSNKCVFPERITKAVSELNDEMNSLRNEINAELKRLGREEMKTVP